MKLLGETAKVVLLSASVMVAGEEVGDGGVESERGFWTILWRGFLIFFPAWMFMVLVMVVLERPMGWALRAIEGKAVGDGEGEESSMLPNFLFGSMMVWPEEVILVCEARVAAEGDDGGGDGEGVGGGGEADSGGRRGHLT